MPSAIDYTGITANGYGYSVGVTGKGKRLESRKRIWQSWIDYVGSKF